MKKILFPLLIASMLASCGPTTNPSVEDPTSNDITTETQPSTNPTTSVTQNNGITIEVPTDLGVELTPIIDAKKGTEGDYFYVYGIIAQFTYSYDGKVGFYLVDNTSSMYIYKGSGLDNLEIGDAVLVDGSIAYFISQAESGAGAEIGYKGAQQIKANNVEVINSTYTEIPDVGIETKTIKELSETNFRDRDLSGTIFRVNATLSYSEVSGTHVYFFNDPSMDYSVYTYSTMGGSDFDWLSSYVGKTYEWTIAIHSLRSKDEAWRVIPIEPFMEVTINDDQKAEYALDRLVKQFKPTYNTTTSLDLITSDEKLGEGNIVTYKTDSSDHIVADNKLSIDATKVGTFNLTITLSYKGKTYERRIAIEVVEKAAFDGISCLDVQSTADGEIVKVKGIYLRTAANVTGIYIADETGILVVYHTAAFDPTTYKNGEELIFEGEVVTDFTADGTVPGYKRLSNATLVSNDSVVHEWNKELSAGNATVEELLENDTSRVGKLYKVEGKVKTTVSSYFTRKDFYSLTSSKYISLYSGSANQISWLDDYEDQEITAYIFIRDVKNNKLRYEILIIE